MSTKTRFTVKRFNAARGRVLEIMRSVADNYLTHANMLDLRTRRLHEFDDYKRLPQACKDELNGMLRGMVEWLWIKGDVVWCHRLNGRYYVPEVWRDLGGVYLSFDAGQSAYVWTETLESEKQRVW